MAASNVMIFLATLLFILTKAAANPSQCYLCLEKNAADCTKNQVTQTCASDRNAVGITHCASAAGKFLPPAGEEMSGFARGCINCTDKDQACKDLGTFLKKTKGFTLKECTIECCTTNLCNTGTPSLTTASPTGTASPTSTASRQVFVSGAAMVAAAFLGLYRSF